MPQFHGIIAPHTLSLLPHEANRDILPKYQDLVTQFLHLANKIADFAPDVVVIISPRGTCLLDAVSINIPTNKQSQYHALLAEIGKPNKTYEFDKLNAHSITKKCQEQQLPLKEVDNDILDYGALTPIHYLLSKTSKQPELIILTMGLVNPIHHYKIGELINTVYQQEAKKVLFIAASTLSAKLTKESPAGYSRFAKGFETELRQIIKKNNHEAIQQMDPFLLDEVGELAVRPIASLMGFLHKEKQQINEYNYSAPEGIGQLFAGTL